MSGVVSLDLTVPFVREVFAIVDEDRSHDTAIDMLIAAERKHGMRIVRDDGCGSLAISLAPRDPARRLTIAQFLELIAKFPSRGTDEQLAAFFAMRDVHYRPASDEETDLDGLHGFLTETSLVLGGIDFANDHWIELEPGGILCSWTQRAWGSTLVEWAKTTSLSPFGSVGWDYAEYCFYLHNLVERYDVWCAAALEVIREKCARQAKR